MPPSTSASRGRSKRKRIELSDDELEEDEVVDDALRADPPETDAERRSKRKVSLPISSIRNALSQSQGSSKPAPIRRSRKSSTARGEPASDKPLVSNPSRVSATEVDPPPSRRRQSQKKASPEIQIKVEDDWLEHRLRTDSEEGESLPLRKTYLTSTDPLAMD